MGVHIMLYSYLMLDKSVHLPGAQILKSCTRRPKCTHRVHTACVFSTEKYVTYNIFCESDNCEKYHIFSRVIDYFSSLNVLQDAYLQFVSLFFSSYYRRISGIPWSYYPISDLRTRPMETAVATPTTTTMICCRYLTPKTH